MIISAVLPLSANVFRDNHLGVYIVVFDKKMENCCAERGVQPPQ